MYPSQSLILKQSKGCPPTLQELTGIGKASFMSRATLWKSRSEFASKVVDSLFIPELAEGFSSTWAFASRTADVHVASDEQLYKQRC